MYIDASSGVTLRYRMYSNEAFAHVYTAVGPFPSPEKSSYDAILRFETDIANDGEWFTDANGYVP